MAEPSAVIRRAKALLAAPAPVARLPAPAAINATGPRKRGRLVLAVDATSSRQDAWKAAQRLTSALFSALPGELDVALAVHGGDRVHTFTPFSADAGFIRHVASRIECQAGYTRFLDILRLVLGETGVGVIVYIGDSFEESRDEALRLADALAVRGTRVVILHDRAPTVGVKIGTAVFDEIAARTGGAVLPFDTSALPRLRELLAAIGVLAVGGPELLAAKEAAMPGARRLLDRLEHPARREGREPAPIDAPQRGRVSPLAYRGH